MPRKRPARAVSIHDALQGTSYKKPLSVPDFLIKLTAKERIRLKSEILSLLDQKIIGYYRTAAAFKRNPKNGAMWVNCKEGSRQCSLIDSIYIDYDGYCISDIYLLNALPCPANVPRCAP